MKGHIRKRGTGNWYAVVDRQDAATGKRKRKWIRLNADGKRQAQVQCAQIITDLQRGRLLGPSKTTLGGYLNQWLVRVKPRLAPRTAERYNEIVQKHLVPLLGASLIANLRPDQIADTYAEALATGRIDGTGGLSPATVVYIHRILKQALADAVRFNLIHSNPADAVRPPRIERKPLKIYDFAQTAALLDGLSDSRLYIPVLIGVLCGLRRGEIIALRWKHVDFENRQLSVIQSAEQTRQGVRYKEPKSGKSRTVALSARAVEALRTHRARQAEELLRVGVRPTEETFIYTREDGKPVQPATLTHAWMKVAGIDGIALPRIRFHDLRHAHATHLLASGVHPKVASERLGHSKVGITLDLYSHVLPGMQREAAEMVDAAIAAVRKRS
jgi:integrase